MSEYQIESMSYNLRALTAGNSWPKLLLVDSNLNNLMALERTFAFQQYKLEFSRDGISALELMNSMDFDMVLLAFEMQDVSGTEICKMIRACKKFEVIPIIFLSTSKDKDSILKGFNAGAQDFISQPFEETELLARIKTHLVIKFSREQLVNVNKVLKDKIAEKTGELEKFNNEIQELDSNKLNFLRIISHEIRTPLNTLIGPISLIKESLKSKKHKKLLDMMETSASRLERFTLTALAITELKTLKYKFSMIEINLFMQITKAIKSAGNLVKQKNLKIDIVTDSNEIIVNANESLVSMCLKGILENAIIFSPQGGTVKIRIENRVTVVVCEFSDEGPGFSEAALKYLYRLFMPGEPHIDQNMGLDLTLARLIMDAHSGNIQVENLPDCGARIRLIFTK